MTAGNWHNTPMMLVHLSKVLLRNSQWRAVPALISSRAVLPTRANYVNRVATNTLPISSSIHTSCRRCLIGDDDDNERVRNVKSAGLGFSGFGKDRSTLEDHPGVFVTLLTLFFVVSVLFPYDKMAEWSKLDDKWKHIEVEAASVSPADSSEEDAGSSKEEEEEEVEGNKRNVNKRNKRPGFRDRRVIEYENRIRQYSTPDKIFRYFATIKIHVDDSHTTGIGEWQVFMLPQDFVRSITPGVKQPEGLGLDQFKRYDPKEPLELRDLNEDSIFYKLGQHGLISFSDYIFLLTILSTPQRYFELAFRMFDFNGDGEVDIDEFNKVHNIIRSQTSIGARHRDHANTGNTIKPMHSALFNYFFGENRDQKLTVNKFISFQVQLQKEILEIEFNRKCPDEEGKISEVDFAELILAYAALPDKKHQRMLRRVKKGYKDNMKGVSFDQFLSFFYFLKSINDVDTALTFYHMAGASVDPATLKHVAKSVAHVELDDHVIGIVFTLFDENGDGQLSNREFTAVMKNRLLRGLEKSKDTGFVKLLDACWRCALDTKSALLDI